MTKLMEWLTVFVAFLAIWTTLLLNKFQSTFIEEHKIMIYALPVIIVGLFGLYSVVVVLYRTLTFNTCEEAAKELQKDILEARKELLSKGFLFKTK